MTCTRIKTCGMSRPQDIAAVNAARPDFCGFVVDFPASRRSVAPEQLAELRGMLDEGIAAVGVFVDEDPHELARIAAAAHLDYVQLHGHEDAAYLEELRKLTDTRVIQAFRVHSADDLEVAAHSAADLVLLDAGVGGGRAFDWELIGDFDRPYLLAGGLTPESIPTAIEQLHPFGIDLSSGIETDGHKDPEKIARAVAACHGTTACID